MTRFMKFWLRFGVLLSLTWTAVVVFLSQEELSVHRRRMTHSRAAARYVELRGDGLAPDDTQQAIQEEFGFLPSALAGLAMRERIAAARARLVEAATTPGTSDEERVRAILSEERPPVDSIIAALAVPPSSPWALIFGIWLAPVLLYFGLGWSINAFFEAKQPEPPSRP